MRERSFWGATIFVLLLLCIPGSVMGQDTAQAESEEASAAQSIVRLNVLTWNIKGGSCTEKRSYDDLTPVVTELQHRKNIYNLDVIALQEAFSDQVDRIKKAVGFGYMHFYPTFTCGGDSPGRGNAIISRYRIEENRKRHRVFSHQHPDEDEQRNIIRVSISVKGERVYLYTTHLTAKPAPSIPDPPKKGYCPSNDDSCESNFFRAQQAGESIDFVNEDRQRDRSRPFRAILMGDFNAERNPTIDFSYNAYANVRTRFRDAWGIWAQNHGISIDSPRGYTNPTGKPAYDPSIKRIDYVFLRNRSHLNVIKAARLRGTKNASDHFPVFVRLSLY